MEEIIEEVNKEPTIAELIDIINDYKEMVGLVLDKYDEDHEEITRLKSALYDGLLNPLRDEINEGMALQLKQRKDDFIAKVGERLSALDNKVRLIEGDPNISLVDIAFDNYDKLEDKPDLEKYADEFEATTKEYIEQFINDLTGVETEQAEEAKEEVKEGIEEVVEEVRDKYDIKEEGIEDTEETSAEEEEALIKELEAELERESK